MGVLAMSVFSTFRGKELEDDPEFQKRMQDPHFREMIENRCLFKIYEPVSEFTICFNTITFLLACKRRFLFWKNSKGRYS